MKAIKLSVISAAVILSTSAMANVVTNAAAGTAKAVKNTGAAVLDGTKTFVKTATRPGAVSLEAGTLGAGANLSWSANEKTEVVAGWTGGNVAKIVNEKIKVDGVEYKLDTKFSNPYLGVQVRPAANWFTVGTGVIVPDNKFDVSTDPSNAKADAKYSIKGKEVDVKEVGALEGKVEHRNRVAPYLTVGFRPNVSNKWGVYGEVGAAYLGQTRATLTSKETSTDAELNKKRAEHIRNLEDSLEGKNFLKWAPIAKVGVSYRF